MERAGTGAGKSTTRVRTATGGGRRPAGEMTAARIARLAGVSAPTVSKVLNGRSGVSTSTRQRIEEVIREHGYQRGGRLISAPTIEIVFQALDSLWALEIIRGVEERGREEGLAVAVTEMHGRLTPERGWVGHVLARRPLGVIAVSAHLTADQQVQLDSRAIPLVILDPSGEPAHHTASVGTTNWNGGLSAARHLVSLGHRRVAMINGPDRFICCRARLDGFRAGLETAGISLDPRLLRVAQLHVEDGLAAARELLDLPDPPTAIFTANDLQALGVYEAARQSGRRIPEDLSVVGFDDLPFVRWAGPPLTTVRQPLQRMGAAAADLVLALANRGPIDHNRVELPTTLVVRESTAAPPPDRPG